MEMSPLSPIEMSLRHAVVETFGGRAMTVIQMGERELTRLRVLIDLGVTTRKCILMSAPIISCRASDRIDAVLATMTPRKIRHVPVIDGEQLSRIVSIGDLVKHRLDEKELEANVLLDITRMRG